MKRLFIALAAITVLPDCTTGLNDLDITGNQTVSGTLAVTGATTITGALAVTGAVTGPAKIATKTDDYTATAADCGGTILLGTNDKAVTLPAVATANAGCVLTLVNIAADGGAQVTFSPNASDAIFGSIVGIDSATFSGNGTDAKGIINTHATANKGDFATIQSDGSTGWYLLGGVGIWANNS